MNGNITCIDDLPDWHYLVYVFFFCFFLRSAKNKEINRTGKNKYNRYMGHMIQLYTVVLLKTIVLSTKLFFNCYCQITSFYVCFQVFLHFNIFGNLTTSSDSFN